MSLKQSVFAVVPAFNEEGSIGSVVEGLTRIGVKVIVVDDGSIDATGEAALEAGAVVLRHPINRGQGAAIGTGITYALRMGGTHVVTFDADGQHDPADVPRMLEALTQADADIALGSRFLGRAPGISPARRALLRVATLFTNLTTGIHLSDAHNGLRLMTAKAANAISLHQDGMAHASEIIEQIRVNLLKVVEVPVTIRYTDYSKKKGQSGLGSLNVLYNLLARRLR